MSVQLSTDTDFQILLASNERVMVKYYADWCGSCKLFSPKYKRIAGDEANTAVAFLDVNAEENEQARKLAGVDNLPFFATFYKGELLEGSATSKEENVKAMIERLMAKN
ncbi:MAG: thioredoxin family protein [Bacteroidetes bacterium]|nr:thioredoxin family protein [Bacteroidota bacterium]